MSYEEEKQDRKIDQLGAEIERLRAELARVAHIREIEIDQAGASERIYLEAARLKEARIEELLAELASANVELMAAGEIVVAKDARIQELEESLVDARGKLFHQFGDVELDPPGEDDCRIVREMLQAEGKIGPDASKPRSWQITEARKAVIQRSAELFEEDASELEGEEYTGAYTARQKSLEIATVLRAMLEAGQ